jgi:hypothetical protein
MEAVGCCGPEIVSRGLTRVTSHGADLASGALLQISHQTLHLIRIDCSERRTYPLGTLVYRIQRNVHRPVTAVPCGDCGATAKHYEE